MLLRNFGLNFPNFIRHYTLASNSKPWTNAGNPINISFSGSSGYLTGFASSTPTNFSDNASSSFSTFAFVASDSVEDVSFEDYNIGGNLHTLKIERGSIEGTNGVLTIKGTLINNTGADVMIGTLGLVILRGTLAVLLIKDRLSEPITIVNGNSITVQIDIDCMSMVEKQTIVE